MSVHITLRPHPHEGPSEDKARGILYLLGLSYEEENGWTPWACPILPNEMLSLFQPFLLPSTDHFQGWYLPRFLQIGPSRNWIFLSDVVCSSVAGNGVFNLWEVEYPSFYGSSRKAELQKGRNWTASSSTENIRCSPRKEISAQVASWIFRTVSCHSTVIHVLAAPVPAMKDRSGSFIWFFEC